MIKKKIFAGIAAAATMVIIGGTIISKTYSTFISKDSKNNSFVTGTIDIENSETIDDKGTAFKNVSSWNAAETPKIVKIHNNSKSSALIRTTITPRWVNEDGTPFAGDTSIVNIKYSQKTRWVKCDDGYYYYKEIVPIGKDTDSLIEPLSANIPIELADRYAGKKLIVDVRSEAVLAGKTSEGTGVYTKTWNIKDDNIKKMLDKLSDINS